MKQSSLSPYRVLDLTDENGLLASRILADLGEPGKQPLRIPVPQIYFHAAPHGCYRCKGDDRWYAITVYTDEEWQSFWKVLRNPDWTKDPSFATVTSRKENEDRLNTLIEEWILQFSPEDVADKMQNTGIASGIVSNGEDLNKNPQLKARDFYPMLDHMEIGLSSYNNPPFKLSNSSVEVRKAAPCLGEHTEYVCREILKLTDEQFIKILQSGALE